MNNTFRDLLRTSTRLTQAGRLHEATQLIQRALHGEGAMPGPATASADRRPVREVEPALILDGCVFEVDARSRAEVPPDRPLPAQPGQGEFGAAAHTHGRLTRRYKLYAPPGHAGRQLPLVVMLHGCTQDPDDFAAGTGMNELALAQGFFVLYPEQSNDANPSRCWNWFKHNHQHRGSGEPALLASMTQTVMKLHDIDPRRVYIAGMSAGAAMATIVACAYPEVFAAVGVHSGLPGGAANNVSEALAVMKSGIPAGRVPPTATSSPMTVPTIVFHGEQDRTVHPRNGEQVIAALPGATLSPRMEHGVSKHGRRYTRSIHVGDQGCVLAEHWLVHGAGHAWAGGCPQGSYTDAEGPDASREMLRFFLEHPHRMTH